MGTCCYKPINDEINHLPITSNKPINDEINHLPDVIDMSTIKTLPSLGEKFECIVKSVYDGDTITVILNLSGLREVKVRLAGFDAPELKPLKKIENRELIIEKAKQARDLLSNKILNKNVILTITNAHEKWGRFLGTIHLDNEDINQFMLNTGLVNVYDGGTKKEFTF